MRSRRLRFIASTLAGVVGLVACGGGDTAEEPTTEETIVPSTPSSPPGASGDARPSIVDEAIADLAEMLDVDPDEIEVVSVEEVDWPDGSIGCPQPGMVYTQAIVNGTRIVLRHDGVDYAYHQGGRRDVFFCPPDRARRPPAPPTNDLDV